MIDTTSEEPIKIRTFANVHTGDGTKSSVVGLFKYLRFALPDQLFENDVGFDINVAFQLDV